MNGQTALMVLTALTGLTFDDIVEEATAETPEQRAEATHRNLRTMASHMKGVPVDELPDFVTYPETGFPGEQNANNQG